MISPPQNVGYWDSNSTFRETIKQVPKFRELQIPSFKFRELRVSKFYHPYSITETFIIAQPQARGTRETLLKSIDNSTVLYCRCSVDVDSVAWSSGTVLL